MKYLITTIAAVVLVGCGESQQSATAPEAKTVKPAAKAIDHSGTYILSNADKDSITLELKPDGSFTGMPKGKEDGRAIGSWKLEGELLICEGTTEKNSNKVVFKFNKTTKKLISLSADGIEIPIEDEIPEGEDGLYLKKLSQAQASQRKKTQPMAECLVQLKMIDNSKELWAVIEKKSNTEIPTKNQLAVYLEKGFPSCPEGGDILIGPVGERAVCSIHNN